MVPCSRKSGAVAAFQHATGKCAAASRGGPRQLSKQPLAARKATCAKPLKQHRRIVTGGIATPRAGVTSDGA
eukprot:5226631-Alexandrium_andersonii.AAC.1